MLNITWKPHRSSLKAETGDPQKVFAMLKLIPDAETAAARPPLALCLVIDTSASMTVFADQVEFRRIVAERKLKGRKNGVEGDFQTFDLDLPTLLDQAIQAAHIMVADPRLQPTDLVSVVHFDSEGSTLIGMTPVSNRPAIHTAIESLRGFSGGTQMATGLRCALKEVTRLPAEWAKRAIVFTDGAASDEEQCFSLLPEFARSNTPIISIGFGEEENTELLRRLADATQGRPYPLREVTDMTAVLQQELGRGAKEVVTDLKTQLLSVKGVTLDSVTRVYPNLAEADSDGRSSRLGNIEKGDYTVFIFELTVEGVERPASRVRIAQLGITASAPGLKKVQEFEPENLFIDFTTDETAIAAVDAEVIGYVQQKNVGRLVDEAVRMAPLDAQRAGQTLQVASSMTQRLGNVAMTQMLSNALDELNQTGNISVGTSRTVALGLKTKTMKTGVVGKGDTGGLSPEDIRRMTGT